MLYEIIELINRLNTEQLLDVQAIVNGRLERMKEEKQCYTK